MTEEQRIKTEAYLAGMRERGEAELRKNEPLCAHCTFRIGGEADYFVEPTSEAAFCALIRFLRTAGVRYLLLGRGSNLLFADGGYRGVIVSCAGLSGVRVNGNEICAQAGVSVTALAGMAQKANLSGMEFYYGIPGSVGGAVFMNAGAYDGETSKILKSVRCLDIVTDEIVELTVAECALSYRHSIFMERRYVILSATFVLEAGDGGAIREKMEELMRRRVEKQPLNYPSAGSTFKRYPGRFTAQMIDEAGLKGARVGGAQVSEKHAGFLINREHATGADMRALIALVKERVQTVHGVKIECEVEMIEERE